MFKIDNVEIEFKPEAIKAVANRALELKTGARGLRTILEEKMLKIMYETPSNKQIEKIVIDENFIKNNGEPMLIFKKINDDLIEKNSMIS